MRTVGAPQLCACMLVGGYGCNEGVDWCKMDVPVCYSCGGGVGQAAGVMVPGGSRPCFPQ